MRLTMIAGSLLLMVAPAFAVVGGGDITMKSKGGDVLFSHEAHVAKAGQKCTACHDKLFTSSKQHKHMTMKSLQQGKFCGACHNGRSAFGIKGNCAKCHKK